MTRELTPKAKRWLALIAVCVVVGFLMLVHFKKFFDPVIIKCPNCEGTGIEAKSYTITCNKCNGASPNWLISSCSDCNSTGKKTIPSKACSWPCKNGFIKLLDVPNG